MLPLPWLPHAAARSMQEAEARSDRETDTEPVLSLASLTLHFVQTGWTPAVQAVSNRKNKCMWQL